MNNDQTGLLGVVCALAVIGAGTTRNNNDVVLLIFSPSAVYTRLKMKCQKDSHMSNMQNSHLVKGLEAKIAMARKMTEETPQVGVEKEAAVWRRELKVLTEVRPRRGWRRSA